MEEVGQGVTAEDVDVVEACGTWHGMTARYTVSLRKWILPSHISVPMRTVLVES